MIKKINISWNNYLFIIPTRNFQINHYSQREWIHYVLNECRDEKKAFDNWMDRDCLFADEINRQCIANGYLSYVNNDEMNIEALEKMVAVHFGFKE